MKKILNLLAVLAITCSAASAADFQVVSNSETITNVVKKKKKVETVTLAVDIHCAMCEKKIMDNIPFGKGIKDLKLDSEDKQVTITYDPKKTDLEHILASFKKIKVAAKELKTDKK